jgi:hypothetical protein
MAACTAHNIDGTPCRAKALKERAFCFVHDPASGAARAEARRRGGQHRHPGHASDPSLLPAQIRNLDDVLALLNFALADTVVLENSIPRGRLLVALCGAFMGAIKTGELENRVGAIEAALRTRAKNEP